MSARRRDQRAVDDVNIATISLAVKFYLLYINFMNRQDSNAIGFLRDLPRLTLDHQVKVMEQHGVSKLVIEGNKVGLKYAIVTEGWTTLVQMLKPGDVIAVARTRVLVPADVWRFQRQLAGAFQILEAIGTKKKPVVIRDLENGWRSDIQKQRDMMWATATEDFQRVARYENSGRPPMNWTREEQALIDAHWFNVKRHETNKIAATAIRNEADELGLVRLRDVDETNLNGHFGASGRGMVRRKDRS
jgi:hypothetical protein